jgi:hypothetical protein
VVSFTRLLLYLRGSSPMYPLDKRLDGPQSRSGPYEKESNLAPAGNLTPVVQLVARRCTDCFGKGGKLSLG